MTPEAAVGRSKIGGTAALSAARPQEPTGRGRLDGAMTGPPGRGDPPAARGPGRRRRRTVRRTRRVAVRLSEEEWAVLIQAAARDGAALAAYVATAATGVARGEVTPIPASTADALRELAEARRQVQRFGVLVNQAVARLHATGTVPASLEPAVRVCAQAVNRLDDAAVRLRPPSS